MKTWTLEINYLPKTVNVIGLAHWALKFKEAKKCKLLVAEQCRLHRIDGLGLKKAELVLTRHSIRQCDWDNLAASFKHIIDGLVACKVIVDDSPAVIGFPTFCWEKAKIRQGKVTVQITSVPEQLSLDERT